jgi:ornithine--oxo-acid transaminase
MKVPAKILVLTLPGFLKIPYDDTDALEGRHLKNNENLAALMLEPIQGEAGVYVPSEGYLKRAKALCEEHNVFS